MIRRLFTKLTDWWFWAGDPNDVFGPTTLDEDWMPCTGSGGEPINYECAFGSLEQPCEECGKWHRDELPRVRNGL